MADQVELLQSGLRNNRGPASESTLEELVAAVRGVESATTRQASGSTSISNTLIDRANRAMRVAGDTTGAVISGLTAFAKEQKNITQLTGTLGDYLGEFGEGLNEATKLVYDNFKAFRTLSRSGIFLGDESIRLTERYAAMGIDLETLQTQLQANSSAFAAFSSTTQGAKQAMDAAARFADNNADALQRFGLNFEEMNETYFDYLNMNAYALQRGTATFEGLDRGAASYAKYLRQLSDLTGQQADQIADQLKQANLNEGFKAYLATLSEGERERVQAMVTAYGAAYGTAGREAAMSAAMGFAPMTDAAAEISAVLPGFNTGLQNAVGQSRQFGGTLEEYQRGLAENLVAQANANQGFIDANSTLAGGLILSGDSLGNTFSGIIAGNQRLVKSQDDMMAIFSDTRPADGFNDAMVNADIAIRDLRIGTTRAAAALIGETGLEGRARQAAEALREIAGASRGGIDTVINGSGATDLAAGRPTEQRQFNNAVAQAIENAAANWQVASGGGSAGIGHFATMFRTGGLGDPAEAFEVALEDTMRRIKEGGATQEETATALTDIMRNFAETNQEAIKTQLQRAVDDGRIDLQGMSLDEYFTDFMQNRMPGVVTGYVSNVYPQLNNGTMGAFGSLFGNFGAGTPAVLHGEEAVIPRDSPIGGMLEMMQGDLGNLRNSVFTPGGGINAGALINQAEEMGARYSNYASENAAGFEEQGRNLARSMGISDEQLDRMASSSVQSNSSQGSGTAINTGTNGLGTKLDELIRLNQQMLDELRNM